MWRAAGCKDFDPFQGGNSGFAARAVLPAEDAALRPGLIAAARIHVEGSAQFVLSESIARAAAILEALSFGLAKMRKALLKSPAGTVQSAAARNRRFSPWSSVMVCAVLGGGGRQSCCFQTLSIWSLMPSSVATALAALPAALPQLHGRAFEVQIVTGLPVLNRVEGAVHGVGLFELIHSPFGCHNFETRRGSFNLTNYINKFFPNLLPLVFAAQLSCS